MDILTGVINVNQVNPEVIDTIFNEGVDLDYLGYIEEEGGEPEEYECDSPTLLLGFKKDADGKWDVDKDAEYSLKYNGDSFTIQVVHSKYIKEGCHHCSPCYPNQADLETEGVLTAYALKAEDIYEDADEFTKSGITEIEIKTPDLCNKCLWVNGCSHKGNPVDCFLPSEEIK